MPSDDSVLDAVVLETGPDPSFAVIWLHGLGADGHDFEGVVREMDLPETPIRFVFPHAPVMRVSVNGGAPMRAWYDVAKPDISRHPDIAGMGRSVAQVGRLVDREISRGIPRERIVLAGFSQGGVIALLSAFSRGLPLGGVLALSTYLPLSPEVALSDSPTPLLMIHGTEDPVVPFLLGKESFERIAALGGAGERRWIDYRMGHSVCLPEIGEIASWLGKIIGEVD
ncbi:MAG: alpha/beta hydrolase [Leptospirillia bacterium]